MSVLRGLLVIDERTIGFASAEAVVRLEDVSLADAPARLVAETAIKGLSRSAADAGRAETVAPFVLTFDQPLDARRRYALRGRLEAADPPLRLFSDERAPVSRLTVDQTHRVRLGPGAARR